MTQSSRSIEGSEGGSDAKKNVDVHRAGVAVRSQQGEWIVMTRNAKIAIYDDNGREREKYPVMYGA
ncbi:hypothetical protein MYX04_14440, partial [Nitrospiraceae bacterium AH_259_D15_M11_P09]|nr:hypothetical protein [Nitrospiraceae bacterium AH_259_D15_M11_P09]